MLLVIDEHLHAMLFGEAVGRSLAVFVNAADEIIRDADIERPSRAAGQDVHPVACHARPQHGLPGQARQ